LRDAQNTSQKHYDYENPWHVKSHENKNLTYLDKYINISLANKRIESEPSRQTHTVTDRQAYRQTDR